MVRRCQNNAYDVDMYRLQDDEARYPTLEESPPPASANNKRIFPVRSQPVPR